MTEKNLAMEYGLAQSDGTLNLSNIGFGFIAVSDGNPPGAPRTLFD
jgi:hypothetical protein